MGEKVSRKTLLMSKKLVNHENETLLWELTCFNLFRRRETFLDRIDKSRPLAYLLL